MDGAADPFEPKHNGSRVMLTETELIQQETLMSAITDLLKGATAVGAVALARCFPAMPVRATPRMPVARTEAARFMNRAFVACALVTFGLIASHTSASAGMRKCSYTELSHLPGGGNCASGSTIRCDSVSGKGFCCKGSGNTQVCTEITGQRVTIPPPVPKPGVKVDVPPIQSVSPPQNPIRPPRVDPPPSRVGPSKSTGPAVK